MKYLRDDAAGCYWIFIEDDAGGILLQAPQNNHGSVFLEEFAGAYRR